MTPEIQSVLTVVVIVGAAGYLARRWWLKRQRAQAGAGCGNSDECACPVPKLERKS